MAHLAEGNNLAWTLTLLSARLHVRVVAVDLGGEKMNESTGSSSRGRAEKSQQMQKRGWGVKKKSSQNSGADIRKPLSGLKRRLFSRQIQAATKQRFSSPPPPRRVIQSCVYSRSRALNCLRKSFFLFFPPPPTLPFLPALRSSPHTLTASRRLYPSSCASDVSDNVSSRKW